MARKLLLLICIVGTTIHGNDINDDSNTLSISSSDERVSLQSNSDSKLINFLDEEQYSDDLDILSEYEMHVCDNCTPTAVSDWRALFTRIGGSVLIRYFIMQENIKGYYTNLKRCIYSWLNLI